MARKTVEVKTLVTFVNERLALSSADSLEFRRGLCSLLEEVLHTTGNYAGYGFLKWDEVSEGKPGIHWNENFEPCFTDTDLTRRRYFYYGK